MSCNATEALEERLEIRKGNGNSQPKDGFKSRRVEKDQIVSDEAHKNIHNHNILGETNIFQPGYNSECVW